MELMNIITDNNLSIIKRKAIVLAPGGRPRFELIFDSNNPTRQLSFWNKEYGKPTVTKLISILIEDLNVYFNVSRPMTAGQQQDLAIEIVEALWWIRMEEIVAFFEAVKKQTYGKIYERLDAAIIWEYWRNYELERENYLYNEQMKFKQSDPREKQENAEVTKFGKLSEAIGNMKNLINKKP